jgi:hypothetical protein
MRGISLCSRATFRQRILAYELIHDVRWSPANHRLRAPPQPIELTMLMFLKCAASPLPGSLTANHRAILFADANSNAARPARCMVRTIQPESLRSPVTRLWFAGIGLAASPDRRHRRPTSLLTIMATVEPRPNLLLQALPEAEFRQALHVQAQQSAACNASHSVEARLSRWQSRARDLHDGETLPLTQETLARAIGVQRNAISMVARALQKAGIIGYSRGQIASRDLEALRAISCECDQIVRSRHRQLIGEAR